LLVFRHGKLTLRPSRLPYTDDTFLQLRDSMK
jgi:hypothetical protein